MIGDVSGHGVSAGMLMASLQTVFHTLTPETNSPVDVLKRINRLYIHNINFTTFVTLFFARLDPQTRLLSYASAGHNPPLLYRPSTKEGIWLKPTGAGDWPGGRLTDFGWNDVQLAKGDVSFCSIRMAIVEALNPAGNGAVRL